jgi:hypothetical protein
MATLVRKQVYLEARQDARLKALAHRLGVSEAALIRQALDRALGSALGEGRAIRVEAWVEARAYRDAWVTRAGHRPTRRWSREELYDERLDRHGRARSG